MLRVCVYTCVLFCRRAAGNLSSGAAFTSLTYSADGSMLFAGGRSKYVCVYDVVEKVLLRRFQVRCGWWGWVHSHSRRCACLPDEAADQLPCCIALQHVQCFKVVNYTGKAARPGAALHHASV